MREIPTAGSSFFLNSLKINVKNLLENKQERQTCLVFCFILKSDVFSDLKPSVIKVQKDAGGKFSMPKYAGHLSWACETFAQTCGKTVFLKTPF